MSRAEKERIRELAREFGRVVLDENGDFKPSKGFLTPAEQKKLMEITGDLQNLCGDSNGSVTCALEAIGNEEYEAAMEYLEEAIL